MHMSVEVCKDFRVGRAVTEIMWGVQNGGVLSNGFDAEGLA